MKIKIAKDVLLCLLFSAFLLLFLFVATDRAGPYFGEFGTSTETDDTCYLCFSTFDTLGNSANAIGDSVYYIRLIYNGTLLDSTYGGTKVRNYTYCLKIKAYDGTNLGQYTVDFFWRPWFGRWYNDVGTYIVKPETTEVNRSGYSLTQSFPTNFSSFAITAGGSVTVGTNSDKTGYTVSTVQDKTGYSLTQSFPTNFSSFAITAGGAVTVGTNSDKTGYSLSSAAYGILADTVWKKDTTDYRLLAGKMGEYLVHKTGAGASVSDIWTWQGTITLKDTLRLQGAASGLTAAQIWAYSSRTLTSDFARLEVPFRSGVYGLEDSVRVYVGGVLKSTEKNYWYGFRLDSTRVINY